MRYPFMESMEIEPLNPLEFNGPGCAVTFTHPTIAYIWAIPANPRVLINPYLREFTAIIGVQLGRMQRNQIWLTPAEHRKWSYIIPCDQMKIAKITDPRFNRLVDLNSIPDDFVRKLEKISVK